MKNLFIRNPDLENKIVDLYQEGMDAREVLRSLNNPFKTTKSVYDILRKHGLEPRHANEAKSIKPKNSFFFSKIDSKAKAYILGLMITDGWILQDRDALGFSSIDRELTEIVRNNLSPESQITVVPSRKRELLGHTILSQESYQVQIYDKQLKEDLIRLGFSSEKTFNEFLPYIYETYMSHLIRGIFDGDGSIYKLSKVQQPGIIFYSGSVFLLKQISIFLWQYLRLEIPEIKKATSIHKIIYAQYQYVDKLMKYIYQDSENLRMIRKYKIWEGYEDKVDTSNWK